MRTVFVTYADERASLAATMRLSKELPDDVQIVAVTTRQTGTATMLDTMDADLALPRVRTFHLLDSVCQPEVFMNNVTEQIAQALHENFLEDRRHDGTFDPGKLTHRSWERLAESYRESNRDQAVRYHERLGRAGYRVDLTDEWDVVGPAFSEQEIEDMAETEHRRWCEERTAAGWVYDPVHDEARQRHPDLRPWSELGEVSKNKDREIVRELPQVLAALRPGHRPRAGAAVAGGGAGHARARRAGAPLRATRAARSSRAPKPRRPVRRGDAAVGRVGPHLGFHRLVRTVPTKGKMGAVSRFFAALGRGVVRLRWVVVIVWLVGTVVTVRALPTLASQVDNNNGAFLPPTRRATRRPCSPSRSSGL